MSIDPRLLTDTLTEVQNAIPAELQVGPAPVVGNENKPEDRFFTGDLAFRNDIILAFEAEFNTMLTPEVKWNQRSFFFVVGDSMFYYKPFLQSYIDKDIILAQEDEKDPEHQDYLKQLLAIEPTYNPNRLHTLDHIKEIMTSNSAGFPTFVAETPNFYEFKNIATKRIIIDDITKDLLAKIRSAFIGPYIPFPFDNLTDFLYEHEDNVYWTYPLSAVDDQTSKKYNLGIFWDAEIPTEKYPRADKEFYFFPYTDSNNWSDQQTLIINAVGNNEARVRNKQFCLINL